MEEKIALLVVSIVIPLAALALVVHVVTTGLSSIVDEMFGAPGEPVVETTVERAERDCGFHQSLECVLGVADVE